MVAILEKSEHNVDFHPIVDFVEASHLRIETTKEGTKILATIDGRIVPLFDSMLTSQGKGLGTPTKPYYTPSPEAQQTSPTTHLSPTLPPITTAPIPTVTLSDTPHLSQYTKRARIAQSPAFPPVANEPASPLRDVNQGEAFLTVSTLDAEQDRENIAKTSTLPHESTSRARVKLLEDRERGGAERSRDNAPIKGRRLDEGEEAAKKGSNNIEEMINVLTSMDAATVLSSGVAEVPTAVEEAERFKRKGIRFEQESVKKLKTSEEVKATEEVPEEKVKEMIWSLLKTLVKESLSIKPPTSDKEMELWVELKRLYEPDDEDQLWTHTQNLMHDLVEWKLYDTCGVHHVTSKDKEIFMLVEKDYPLRKGLALVMISYKLQVENYSQMANDLNLKIYKIANYPSQQGIPTACYRVPTAREVPTASEESFHCQKKRDPTAVKIRTATKVKQ
nr:hypothetical protein [Tanacetum cinerariifolium]